MSGPIGGKPEAIDLWKRIETFSVDAGDEQLTFCKRLARENKWDDAFAQRVIAEYKRFLFLACTAGHKVTPSEEVDHAWHLHLVYTESYWGDLCPNVLRRPLHHGPTKGGASEDAKFEDWYTRTIESYAKTFGEPPPQDIWPVAAIRFGRAAGSRRADSARVTPRPRAASWAAAVAVLAVGVGAVCLPNVVALFRDERANSFQTAGGIEPWVLIGILMFVALLGLLRALLRGKGPDWLDAGGRGHGPVGSGCAPAMGIWDVGGHHPNQHHHHGADAGGHHHGGVDSGGHDSGSSGCGSSGCSSTGCGSSGCGGGGCGGGGSG